MKRTISFMLIFLLVFSLSACGAGRGTGENTTEAEKVTEATVETETGTVTETETVSETETEAETTAVKKISAAEAKASYKKTLEKILNGSIKLDDDNDIDPSGVCFSLIYLDDDDVPELAVSTGAFHPSYAVLFSYDGNKVINNGLFGSFGSFGYLPRKGIIASSYSGMGIIDINYLKFEDNTVFELASVREENGIDFETAVQAYYIGETEVPKEAYEAEVSRYGNIEDFSNAPAGTLIPDSDTALPEGVYALTKENINKI